MAYCDIPPKGVTRSVTGIGNHTGIVKQFDCFLQPFAKLFQRRAFLHWFVGEGMEETGLFVLMRIDSSFQCSRINRSRESSEGLNQ